MKRSTFILTLLFISRVLFAQIMEETGTLRGFLLGEAPGCAYDNWVSHVVEGLADEGYNAYNPHDPQSGDFGQYSVIDPDSTDLLAAFKIMFGMILDYDFSRAESLRVSRLGSYPFTLVALCDTSLGRDFLLVREGLDSSYVDPNLEPGPEDDEVGSFNLGWGLYIYQLQAVHPEVQIEVVHPNDDYLSPHIACDWFTTLDAGAFYLAGAGREALWSEQGDYGNNKSLSDPSRNANSVLQMAHEAFVDHFLLSDPDGHPFTVQIHSYDSEGRDHVPEVVLTPHRDDHVFNLPLFDWSGVLGGFIDRTPEPVQPAGVIGNPEAVNLESFYGCNSEPPLVIMDADSMAHTLGNPGELLGNFLNHQLNYRGDLIDRCQDTEWLLHLEFDELPNSLPDTTEAQFYGEPGLPITWRNFQQVVDYYHVIPELLREVLDTMNTYGDNVPPRVPENLAVCDMDSAMIELNWLKSGDPYFGGYRLYYSSSPEVDQYSDFLDREHYPDLCEQTTESITIEPPLTSGPIHFRLGAVDLSGHISELSGPVTVPSVLFPKKLYFSSDCDEDTSGWYHTAPDGWNEEWHISTQSHNTPPAAWKCGSQGGGDYTDHQDARLVSPPVYIHPWSELSFQHRIDAETASAHPDSAFDGGIVEISLDDGDTWEQLNPGHNGYNCYFKHLSGSSPATHPFTPGIPCFSGDLDWREVTCNLADYMGNSVRLAWRFGSDNGYGDEGWFVDDIRLRGYPVTPLVTISFQEEQIHLTWEQLPGTLHYLVYSAPYPWGEYVLLTQTTFTEYLCDTSTSVSFFRVVAVY
jgi:hypothetical protein